MGGAGYSRRYTRIHRSLFPKRATGTVYPGKGLHALVLRRNVRGNECSGQWPTRITQLRSLGASRGAHGALEGLLLNRIKLMASYRTFYGRPDQGIFHGEAHLLHTIPRITVRAAYDKQGIGSIGDLRRLNARSMALAEATYRIYPHLRIGFEYRWTYAFDDNPNVRTYNPQERFSPRIMFDLAF